MNTIRPKPYPQRGNGNYNAGNDGTDKDGHNQNGQEYQNQRQTVARGRADELQLLNNGSLFIRLRQMLIRKRDIQHKLFLR